MLNYLKNMNIELSNENAAVVDALVTAYNSGDARTFADLFAPDVKIFEFPDELVQESSEEIFEFYEKLFGEFPNNRTEVLHRIIIGNRVIDHERVRRSPETEPFEVLTIYELQNGKIKRLDFVRK